MILFQDGAQIIAAKNIVIVWHIDGEYPGLICARNITIDLALY